MEVAKLAYHEIPSPSEKLNQLRKEGKTTDTILLTADGTEFHVHKLILSTCTYFEALFNSNSKKSNEDKIQLHPYISPKDFEVILTYIYTGKIEIPTAKAFIINVYACFFVLMELKEASEAVIVKDLAANLLTVWRWAKKCSNNVVEKKCMEHIRKNPLSILEEQLLSLKYDEVMTLASYAIFDEDHDKLYNNLIKWIKKDLDNREKYIADLLKFIDFTQLTIKLKTEIKKDKVLFNNLSFVKVLADIPLNENIHIYLNDLVFAIAPQSIAALKLHEPKPCIVPIITCDFNSTFSPVYCKLDKILFCGLGDGSECKMFSYGTGDFTCISPMIEKRIGFDIIKLNETIYACGGADNNFMEIYDINVDKWTKCKKAYNRYDLKICNHRQSILLLGGCCPTKVGYVENKYIQRYDPRENIWKIIVRDALPMPNIQDVFVIEDDIIRCLYKKDNKLLICGYDLRNRKKVELSNELPNFIHYNLYKSKEDIYILGKEDTKNPMFGLVKGLDSKDTVQFSAFPDIDLNCYNDNIVKLLNVGADRYNYFGTRFSE